MKLTTKMLLKLNPNYLNNIDDNDLNDEIILYALENGYDFNKDKFDRFCKYESYVNYNFNKDKAFVYTLILSKHFNINSFTDNMINYIKKEKSNLLIRSINKDINFIKYLDNECNFNDKDIEELFNILDYKNINYSELNEIFLNNNIRIGLKYLEKDFSNIVNFKKYNENYNEYQNDILNIFSNNIKDNIVYLNEISEFELDNDIKDKIIDTLKDNPIIVNEQTPKFIYENKYVIFNLLINDLGNAKYIDREIDFNGEQLVAILDKIIKEQYVFDNVPLCFKKSKDIFNQIIVNNPYIIDNKDTKYFTDTYKITNELIKLNKYKINNNTRIDMLEKLCEDYLDEILDSDFESIKYFEKLERRFRGNQEKLYEVLKNNNYIINETLPICLQNNDFLIKEGLESNKLDLNSLDLKNATYKYEFEIYLINYALDNGIVNEEINKWRENFINRNKKDIRDDDLYIKDSLHLDHNLDFPKDIKEIFVENNDVNNINKIIDKVKNSNNNIERIVVDLKLTNYTLEELNSIKDKDMVVFGSKGDITRLTVNKLIEIENTLNLFVKDINESDLSPYEKYIAVYNIVKSFKRYQFYKDDEEIDHKYADQSRGIYLIMDNDYIVCVGYARLLETLLKRVEINSIEWGVQSVNEAHSRNYVNLVDPKYNIDGYYMCDATWDNVQMGMMEIGYNHMHLTRDEARSESNIKKDETGKAMLGDEIFNDYTDEEMFKYLSKSYYDFIEKIFKLDPEFYEEIKDRKKIDIELASIVNNHFKNKINKPIDRRIDAKAIFELKEYIYGKSESLEEKNRKWNNFVVESHYPYDLLMDDYNIRINEIYKELKTMKVIDYYNIISDKKIGAYDKFCYTSANYKLLEEFLPQYDKTYFGINFSDNKLTFDISVSPDLFKINKIDEVFNELIDNGYSVEKYWNETFKFNLDINDINKTFEKLYNQLNLIREEYINILNKKLGNNLSV